jgi:type II secretory pathway component PulF
VTAFTYRAVTAAGKRIRGREEALSAQALVSSLGTRGFTVLDVAAGQDDVEATSPEFRLRRSAGVVEMTRAMAALLPAGLPLTRSLTAVANLSAGELAKALVAVRARVERGDTLAAALADHPGVFSPIYVGVVRAGERSGNLPGAFARLSAQLEREQELRNKLLSAAIYPILLGVAGGIAVTVLLLFVLPRFAELLVGSGAALPRSTALLLGFSAAAREFWPLFLGIPVALVAGIMWALRTSAGSRAYAKLLLRTPVVGTFRRQQLASRFARLVGVLLYGGTPLLNALDDATHSLSDPLASDEVLRVRTRVREGASLHGALAEGGVFPDLLGQLVAVGEESGRLQEFLDKAADIFEQSTQRALQRLVAIAEPLMIVIFGGIVGLVALSLMQAIYGINAGSFR